MNAIACKFGEKTLGVEDKEKVKDSQLTSSTNSSTSDSAPHGRLYSSEKWGARVSDKNQWIQVDLGKKEVVTGIATKGGVDRTYGFYSCWVKTYSVMHSLNGKTLGSYKNGGAVKVRIIELLSV